MGHLGFTPQSVNQLGTRVQGRQLAGARQLLADALALQAAGAFAVVLELIPSQLAAEITSRLRIPTIGIGAGPECDGQVQVWHDLLGLYSDFKPRHAKQYLNLADTIGSALSSYAAEVRERSFPTAEHSSKMEEAVLAQLREELDNAGN
jgi:3-methyl-2-oxobutanoate hydroxymethyltransferase